MTTSLRRPVLSSDSFSIVFITARRAFSASADVMSGLTAALTRSVTSSMLISTFSSRSTHLSSSLGVVAWKPSFTIVVLGAGQLLQGVGADVVVGHHQPVGRDERAGAAAVEAHGRLLHVLEPGFGRIEVVFFLEQLARRMVEQPHAFVAARRMHRPMSSMSAPRKVLTCSVPRFRFVSASVGFAGAR